MKSIAEIYLETVTDFNPANQSDWYDEKGRRYQFPKSLRDKGYPAFISVYDPSVKDTEEAIRDNERLMEQHAVEREKEDELIPGYLQDVFGGNVKDYQLALREISDIVNEIMTYDVKESDIKEVYYKDSEILIKELVVRNIPYEMHPFLYEYLKMTSKESKICTLRKKNAVAIKVSIEVDEDCVAPECVEINGKKYVAFTVIAPESRKEKCMKFIDFETLKEELSPYFSKETLDWIEQRKKK